jgi:hypothetical protein
MTRVRRRWPVIALAVLGLTVALNAGCAGKGPKTQQQPEVRIADGFWLELWILGEENYAVLYRVNGASALGFGGGAVAFNRELSWEGTLKPDEYDRLQVLLEQHGWFDGTIVTTGEARQPVSRISLRWPGGSRRLKVKGVSPDIEPVQKLLDRAARRRFDPHLESLPQAGDRLERE